MKVDRDDFPERALPMTERVELKPCPFCGEKPHITRRVDEDLWTHNAVEWIGVRCSECGVGFDWPPGADVGAIEQWNTRAPGEKDQSR